MDTVLRVLDPDSFSALWAFWFNQSELSLLALCFCINLLFHFLLMNISEFLFCLFLLDRMKSFGSTRHIDSISRLMLKTSNRCISMLTIQSDVDNFLTKVLCSSLKKHFKVEYLSSLFYLLADMSVEVSIFENILEVVNEG